MFRGKKKKRAASGSLEMQAEALSSEPPGKSLWRRRSHQSHIALPCPHLSLFLSFLNHFIFKNTTAAVPCCSPWDQSTQLSKRQNQTAGSGKCIPKMMQQRVRSPASNSGKSALDKALIKVQQIMDLPFRLLVIPRRGQRTGGLHPALHLFILLLVGAP